MKDYEYEEENLDDFMINAAKILSEKNNPERNSIIESLKQHLSSIFHNESEMENFFRTLNGVIFTSGAKENSSNTLIYLVIVPFASKLEEIVLKFKL